MLDNILNDFTLPNALYQMKCDNELDLLIKCSNFCEILLYVFQNHFIATTYGVAKDSILNTSVYFHIIDGLCPDIMHDILEGSLQYNLKELLKSLFQRGVTSLDEVNLRISNFPFCYIDSKNKPVLLSPTNLDFSDHNLRQTGMLVIFYCMYMVI